MGKHNNVSKASSWHADPLLHDSDRHAVDEHSEFSWGPGLVPRGYEYAPPGRGGMYQGVCPPVELTRSPDLSVRVRQAKPKPGDPPTGYPGERVG